MSVNLIYERREGGWVLNVVVDDDVDDDTNQRILIDRYLIVK